MTYRNAFLSSIPTTNPSPERAAEIQAILEYYWRTTGKSKVVPQDQQVRINQFPAKQQTALQNRMRQILDEATVCEADSTESPEFTDPRHFATLTRREHFSTPAA